MSRSALGRDRGAAAVETVLVLPLILSLAMGIVTGGFLYNRLLGLTHSSREAARFASTLPTGKVSVADSWLDQVASRAVSSASGDLDASAPDRYVCAAYIGYGSPVDTSADFTRKREQTGSAAPVYTAGSLADPGTWCFDDERGTSGERRVQVLVRRTGELHAMFFSQTITLTARSAVRFEAVSP